MGPAAEFGRKTTQNQNTNLDLSQIEVIVRVVSSGHRAQHLLPVAARWSSYGGTFAGPAELLGWPPSGPCFAWLHFAQRHSAESRFSISGSAFGRFSAKLGPKTPLDRRGSSCSAGCTKNQPRRPILRPILDSQFPPGRVPLCLAWFKNSRIV